MHNLGNELSQEFGSVHETFELNSEFGFQNELFQESNFEVGSSPEIQEYELSPEFEILGETFGEFLQEAPQMESNYELHELQLAQEFEMLSTEAELGAWIKSIAQKGARVASNVLDSKTGRQLTKTLTNIAQKTLPIGAGLVGGLAGGALGSAAGGALGSGFGPAGATIGKAIGNTLGDAAGAYVGQQAGQALANRVPQFVRFATDSIRNFANAGGRAIPKQVLVPAARRHYPFILQVRGNLRARIVPNREFEYENESSFLQEIINEVNQEMQHEMFNEMQHEMQHEMQGEILNTEGTFGELTQHELASELLTVRSEHQLEHFLGKLIGKAIGGVRKFMRSSIGRRVGGFLKGLAKKALPMVGAALGSIIPGAGTLIGGKLGTLASKLFEIQGEAMSNEDREYEFAKAFSRFAGNLVRRTNSQLNATNPSVSRGLIIASARRYAPGMLISRSSNNWGNNVNSPQGTWYRQGNNIILTNAI